jgi:hypothetical protein
MAISREKISHVYVDAAGDPGLIRSPNSSINYVVAAVGVASREQMESGVAVVRRQAGFPDAVELHHLRLRRALAAAVYRELVALPFAAVVVVARKADHIGRWRRPNDLVIEATGLAVVDLVRQAGSANVTVVLDLQRAEVMTARRLRKEISDQLQAGGEGDMRCRVVRHDSARDPGLEVADLVAGAAFRWLERGRDDDWVAISRRCRLIEL